MVVMAMRISDLIETFIKQLLSDEGGEIEIQRNVIAGRFHCVPSQINYVIATRFTNERGYIVESRRGGGGCIRIRLVPQNSNNYIMHIINCIGDGIDADSARAFILNLKEGGLLNEREAGIMFAAINDRVLPPTQPLKDTMRAAIMKNMLAYLN